MDISKEYISMCEKAVEVQDTAPFEESELTESGKSYYNTGLHYIGEVVFYCQNDAGTTSKEAFKPFGKNPNFETWVWLPGQSQLQELLGNYEDIITILFTLGDGNPPTDYDDFTSMEQLWLSFVMKIKFNKIWNGETWV